ncbi:MAG: AraC family transcriptional regulator [Thiotrichales bacterium]
MDALSDVLAAVRLSGSAFLDAEFTSPWCVEAQVGADDCAVLGVSPAQVIAYHYVASGEMFVEMPGLEPLSVASGEILLLSRNDRHVLGSQPHLRPAIINNLIRPPTEAMPATLRHGGGGVATHVICGYLGCEIPHNPLLATLPPMLKLRVVDDVGDDWIGRSFAQAAAEFTRGGPGSATVLGKLAELLFVEAIRRYVATLPEEQTGWLSGLRDRAIGRALASLHARFAENWTTEELAREVGLSRSAFAERFTTLIGVPPMHYLAQWRLQLAATRLRETARATAQIAYEVGYDSEAAFNRAFKRSFGTTPAAWRRRN